VSWNQFRATFSAPMTWRIAHIPELDRDLSKGSGGETVSSHHYFPSQPTAMEDCIVGAEVACNFTKKPGPLLQNKSTPSSRPDIFVHANGLSTRKSAW
jgi:hypothetical protein